MQQFSLDYTPNDLICFNKTIVCNVPMPYSYAINFYSPKESNIGKSPLSYSARMHHPSRVELNKDIEYNIHLYYNEDKFYIKIYCPDTDKYYYNFIASSDDSTIFNITLYKKLHEWINSSHIEINNGVDNKCICLKIYYENNSKYHSMNLNASNNTFREILWTIKNEYYMHKLITNITDDKNIKNDKNIILMNENNDVEYTLHAYYYSERFLYIKLITNLNNNIYHAIINVDDTNDGISHIFNNIREKNLSLSLYLSNYVVGNHSNPSNHNEPPIYGPDVYYLNAYYDIINKSTLMLNVTALNENNEKCIIPIEMFKGPHYGVDITCQEYMKILCNEYRWYYYTNPFKSAFESKI